MTAPDTSLHFPRIKRRLLQHLEQGRRLKSLMVFGEIAQSPADLRLRFNVLSRLFAEVASQEIFLEFLLQYPGPVFSRLDLVSRVVALARDCGGTEAVVAALRARQDDQEAPEVRWSETDHVHRIVPAKDSDSLRNAVRQLKYPGMKRPADPEALDRAARSISRHIDLTPAAFDLLYASRTRKTLQREGWDARVRHAHALDHLIRDFNLGKKAEAFLPPLQQELALPGATDKAEPCLVLTFHGAFMNLAWARYKQMFPEGASLTLGGKNERGISAAGDARNALFAALRTIQDKGSLWLGPDGAMGQAGTPITVAGLSNSIADGAAFIAFQTGCRTLWMTVVRKGGAFAPLVVEAPKPRPKEAFDVFKARFADFYSSQVSKVLLGTPDNVIPGLPWLRVIYQQLRLQEDSEARTASAAPAQ